MLHTRTFQTTNCTVLHLHHQESFSFSTKDRAPYLVTLEVLDYSSRRSSTNTTADDGNAEHKDAFGSGGQTGVASAASAAGGEAGGRGAGKLMRMLTPATLGRSLLEMKAGIDRGITTLKRSVSKDGRELGAAATASAAAAASVVAQGGGGGGRRGEDGGVEAGINRGDDAGGS